MRLQNRFVRMKQEFISYHKQSPKGGKTWQNWIQDLRWVWMEAAIPDCVVQGEKYRLYGSDLPGCCAWNTRRTEYLKDRPTQVCGTVNSIIRVPGKRSAGLSGNDTEFFHLVYDKKEFGS